MPSFKPLFFAFLGASLCTGVCRAEDTGHTSVVVNAPVIGSDVVYLKGGGMVRGVLVERLPNDHATVLLPSGQSVVLPWASIDRFEVMPPTIVEPPPQSAHAHAPPLSLPTPPPQFTGPMVHVHIDANREVDLFYDRPVDGFRWDKVCSSPCDRDLPLTGEYKIKGDGLTDSNPFHLEGAPGGHIVLEVSNGTKTGVALGGTAIGLGLYGSYIGMLIAVSARDEYSGETDKGAQAAGIILGLAGLALAGVGTAVIVSNWHTGVSQTEGAPKSASRSRNVALMTPPPPVRPAALDVRGGPTWALPPVRGGATIPLSFSF